MVKFKSLSLFSRLKNHHILKSQSVAQATILITIFLFLGKIVAYLRQALVAKYFGATGQTDAFLVALLIPVLAMGIVSNGLAALIVPVYIEKREKDPSRAKIFVNQIFLLWCAILLFLSLILFFFAPFFVKLIAFGFEGERFTLAVTLTRYLIPLGFTTALVGFFTGLYQAQKQFLYPIIIEIIGSTMIVLSLIFFAPHLGINSWTIGQLLYAGLTFFTLFWLLWRKRGFFQKFFLKNIQWIETQHFLWLLLPLILSGGIMRLNQIVDKTIASSLPIGSIAVIEFAYSIFYIPAFLLTVPLVTATYPTFSSLALDKNKNSNYVYTLQNALSFAWYLIIPASIVFIILSKPIVSLLFQRGAFTAQATDLTAFAVSMYSIGLFAYAANCFLINVFYSFKNTKTPAILGAIIVGINIICTLTLSRILGVGGIALATTISLFTGFLLYFSILRKYFKGANFKSLFQRVLKIILISVPLGFCAFFFKPYLATSFGFFHLLAKFILVGGLLSLLYFLLSYLFKLEEFKIITKYLETQYGSIKNRGQKTLGK